jgi:hypothetical protein
VGFKKYFKELTELVHDEDGDPDGESSIANLGPGTALRST